MFKWLGKRNPDHPDSWIFGPKRSVKEVVEKRPPMMRIATIAAIAIVASAVSVTALASGGDDGIPAGVPDGVKLTSSNSIRVKENGKVIDALDVKGIIVVYADNVTIKRTRITTPSYHAIRVASGADNLVVEDSTLECTTSKGRHAIVWDRYTATRVAVGEGCQRGFAVGSNTTITDSYWGDEPFADKQGTPAPSTTQTTVKRGSSSWTSPTTATTTPPTTAPSSPATTTPLPSNVPRRPRPANGVAVPASCQNESNMVNGTNPRAGFPTDPTTGPEVAGYDEDFMVPSGQRGQWNISEDNKVIDGVFHNGSIYVTGDNVKILNSVICGVDSHIIDNRGANLLIENSIIRGERGKSNGAETLEPCGSGVSNHAYTIRRSELTNCADGVKIGHTVEIYDSWFHDNYAWRGGPSGTNGGGTHNDTVQLVEASIDRFVFQGNSAYQDPCTSNRHFQLAPMSQVPVGGYMRIEGNFFYGLKLLNMDRGFRVSDGAFVRNTIAGSPTQGPFSPPLYAGSGIGTAPRSGNVYEVSGAPANDNYAYSYQCVG